MEHNGQQQPQQQQQQQRQQQQQPPRKRKLSTQYWRLTMSSTEMETVRKEVEAIQFPMFTSVPKILANAMWDKFVHRKGRRRSLHRERYTLKIPMDAMEFRNSKGEVVRLQENSHSGMEHLLTQLGSFEGPITMTMENPAIGCIQHEDGSAEFTITLNNLRELFPNNRYTTDCNGREAIEFVG